MQPQLKLVHDNITPKLKRIAAAFSRPIVIRIPAPRVVSLRQSPHWPPKGSTLAIALESRRRALLARFPHLKKYVVAAKTQRFFFLGGRWWPEKRPFNPVRSFFPFSGGTTTPFAPHYLSPFQKAQMDRAVRAEIDRLIRSL